MEFCPDRDTKDTIWSALHELAWGDAGSVNAADLAKRLAAFLEQWDHALSTQILSPLFRSAIQADQLPALAPQIFDCLDPLYCYCTCTESWSHEDSLQSSAAAWNTMEAATLGIAVDAKGFSWVEAWSHGEGPSDLEFLTALAAELENCHIPENLISTYIGTCLMLSGASKDKSFAEPLRKSLPLLARIGLSAAYDVAHRVNPQRAQFYKAWDDLPAYICTQLDC